MRRTEGEWSKVRWVQLKGIEKRTERICIWMDGNTSGFEKEVFSFLPLYYLVMFDNSTR